MGNQQPKKLFTEEVIDSLQANSSIHSRIQQDMDKRGWRCISFENPQNPQARVHVYFRYSSKEQSVFLHIVTYNQYGGNGMSNCEYYGLSEGTMMGTRLFTLDRDDEQNLRSTLKKSKKDVAWVVEQINRYLGKHCSMVPYRPAEVQGVTIGGEVISQNIQRILIGNNGILVQ